MSSSFVAGFCSKINDDKMLAYKDFCKSVDHKDLESCLLHDLRVRFIFDYLSFLYSHLLYSHVTRIISGLPGG